MNFIKLSNRIINPSYISSIVHKKDGYLIHVLHTNIHGVYFGVFGTISSSGCEIEVSQKEDVDIISKWINRHATSTFK